MSEVDEKGGRVLGTPRTPHHRHLVLLKHDERQLRIQTVEFKFSGLTAAKYYVPHRGSEVTWEAGRHSLS